MVFYNPLDSYYKSQVGAVRENRVITFRVKGSFNSVVFVYAKDGDNQQNYLELTKKEDCFECSLSFKRGLYFYYFQIDNQNKYISLSTNYNGELVDKINHFQLTVYDKNYRVPEWIKGGIIYQIFPDRFNIGYPKKQIEYGKILHSDLEDVPNFLPDQYGEVLNNDFFGGNLQGIVEKLDYLASLGVTVIYLNPIFKAYSNHRYDTGDYMQIDPLLGDIKDFINLVQSAKEKGIKIVLDGVFNHTGADSLYFNKFGNYDSIGAYQSKNSKYYNWYTFNDFPNQYEAWWGIKTLPAINESDNNFIEFVTGENGVLSHYTRLGIAGWRLDVVDELPGFFVKKIRSAVKKVDKDAIIIGEVWEDASNKISYGVRREYFQGYELDSVMNYPLKNAIIEFVNTNNIKKLIYTIKEQIDHYPNIVLHSLMNIISTHDTFRLLSALSDFDIKDKTKTELSSVRISNGEFSKVLLKVKTATLLQYTLPGVPSIYYGEEAGMEGYMDPLNRRFFPWGNENNDILSWYKVLGGLRSNYSVFSDGEFNEIYSSNGTLIFMRANNEQEVLVAINLSDKQYQLDFDGELFDLLSNKPYKDQFSLDCNTLAVLVNLF